MAEIKSTLDLVLEKTRHLSLSKEEKDRQAQNELKKNLKGLLHKYEDGVLTLEDLVMELNALHETYQLDAEKFLKSEIQDSLVLDQQHAVRLEVLRAVCGVDTKGLENILNQYQGKIERAKLKHIERCKKRLSKEHHISGSAVVPNVATDHRWEKKLKAFQKGYNQVFEKEKARLRRHRSI